ncbi:MAG: radical SAM protein [Rhodobacteraceae bacterium]|nr:radical SAM protein [Paracoccaceae bacterium]
MNIHQTNLRDEGQKFRHRTRTADGQVRASVALQEPSTLWFNTGTLCNIECVNCYIESSPRNDALVYLSLADVAEYLAQIAARRWPVGEIGFTGGEPFMNPDAPAMLRLALERGYRVLVLTNAMRPMMRPRIQDALAALIGEYGDLLTFRISIDHPDPAKNDAIRGGGSHAEALAGMRWLRDRGARCHVAGRNLWDETEAESRAGFAALYAAEGFAIDAENPGETLLFPEMDESADVPEITNACWGILNKSPRDVMCASSRMVVRRKGAARPSVVACTLLPHDLAFDMGPSLAEAEGDVWLNHRHCAKFCVLGGASCSV